MSLAERFGTPKSFRYRLLNWGRTTAMSGPSSIVEGFSELRRRLMREPRYVKARRTSDPYVPAFAKKDFKDGVSGSTGHDLTSAVSQKLVTTGDLITYTLPTPTSQGGEADTSIEVAYVGTPDLEHGGRLGFHKFLRVGENAGRNILYLGGDAFPWRKTGHIETNELLAKIDKSLSSPSQPRY